MAKRSIRKTDPTDTTAPAKRRRTTPSEIAEAKPAVKAAPRARRKTEAPVAVAAAAETAAAAVETEIDGTNGHVDSTFDVPHDQIALRAYHIYLERGYPGDSFHDWVTAERQLREQVTRERS
jgi:hypothetical protein